MHEWVIIAAPFIYFGTWLHGWWKGWAKAIEGYEETDES